MMSRSSGQRSSRSSSRSRKRSASSPIDPELLSRPSWVDAGVAYQQVKKGKALGNSCALWLRWRLQEHLFALGCFVQRHSGKVLFLGLVFLSLWCLGLKTATLETDIEKLWVEEGGRLQKELEYTESVLGVGAGATHEMVIQTSPEGFSRNVLTVPSMLLHLRAMMAAVKVNVHLYDVTWKLNDLCHATNFPSFDDDSFFDRTLHQFIPCMIISPLDCFWEGSKLLGPEYPVFVPYYPENLVTWANLDPSELVETLRSDDHVNFPSGDQVAELLRRAGIGSGYQEKPCLNPYDLECPVTAPNFESKKLPDVASAMNGGCRGFATKYMKWHEDLIIGGVHKNKTGHISRAEAMQSMLVLMGENDLYEYHKETAQVDGIEWTRQRAADVLRAWQQKFKQEVERVAQSPSSSPEGNGSSVEDSVLPFTSTSLVELLSDVSQVSYVRVSIGYLFMILYATFTLMRWSNPVHSQSGVGIVGVLIVGLSVAAGLGLCSVIGIAFNASTTQIVPFLCLGLGVDDMFLIAHTFAEHSAKQIPYHEQTGEVLRRVGVSIGLTSLSNMAAFFLAAIVPIPALRDFCLQVGVLVVFNLLTVVVIFPAVVSIDLIRRNEQKVDIFCCFSGQSGSQQHPLASELRSTGVTAPWAISQTQPDGSHPVTVLAPPDYEQAASAPSSTTSSRQCLATERRQPCVQTSSRDVCSWTLSRFACSVYGPLLEKTCTKVLVTLGFIALLIAGVVGTMRVTNGLEVTDVVPRGTAEYEFLVQQAKYFGFYNFYAVTKDGIDYADEETQQMLLDYHQAFLQVDHIIKQEDGSLPNFWLPMLRDWLQNLQSAFDRDMREGRLNGERWFPNATADAILAYKLIVQTGDMDQPYDKTRVLHGRLVSAEGIIYPPAFYCYVTAWTSIDALAYAASQADFRPIPREWYHDRTEYDLRVPKSQPFIFAQLPFYLHDMGHTEEVTAVIQEVRSICDDFSQRGLLTFPRGVPFTFWEQYVHLRFYLGLALGCVLVAVFIVLTVILLSPWVALVVVFVLASMTVQLFGFMGLIGIRLSAVPAVVLVLSVGIGVEFTVHVALGFLTAMGSRNRRMVVSLEHTLAPVVHGAMSTLVGLIMMATADLDFIVRYFFIVLTALVAIGLLNGLLLLPVLLSFLGPRPEVTSADHSDSDCIQPPTPEPSPPPPRQRHHRGSERTAKRAPYRVPSEISLTTITEEPSQLSSQSQQSHSQESSHISVHVHPEVVVETSVPGANVSVNGSSSGGSSSSSGSSSRNTTPPLSRETNGQAVTKVKATAHVKVEVHTPGASGDQSVEYKSKKRKRPSTNPSPAPPYQEPPSSHPPPPSWRPEAQHFFYHYHPGAHPDAYKYSRVQQPSLPLVCQQHAGQASSMELQAPLCSSQHLAALPEPPAPVGSQLRPPDPPPRLFVPMDSAAQPLSHHHSQPPMAMAMADSRSSIYDPVPMTFAMHSAHPASHLQSVSSLSSSTSSEGEDMTTSQC